MHPTPPCLTSPLTETFTNADPGQGQIGARLTVADRKGCRTLQGSLSWYRLRVRFPAAAGVFDLCILSLAADPRPAFLRNAAPCVGSGGSVSGGAILLSTTPLPPPTPRMGLVSGLLLRLGTGAEL